jgi:hypothetical protein
VSSELWWIFFALALVVSIVGFILWRRRRRKGPIGRVISSEIDADGRLIIETQWSPEMFKKIQKGEVAHYSLGGNWK